MLTLFLIILSGVLVGYLLRKVPQMRYVGVVMTIIITLLLFLLGISVGANEKVIHNFSMIGFDALAITIGGIVGTLLCAWWVYMYFFKPK